MPRTMEYGKRGSRARARGKGEKVMAHEISVVNGVAEAAFAEKPAWHGLGTLVDNLMTPAQALDAAHLRWTVEKRPIYIKAGEAFNEVPDKVATFRQDTNEYLGTVGADWVPVQNEEQANFIAALVGSGAVVECVGALRQGKRTFWTVKAPGDVVIGGQDVVSKYLVVCNGHDGSLAFRAFWSPTRVVCANTLRAALGGNLQDSVALFHRSKVSDHLADARRTLGLADAYYNKLGEEFTRMLDRVLSDAEFRIYVEEVIPETAKEGGPTKMEAAARERITKNYFETGRGREMAGRTAWGAYNAVAEYLSHQKEYSTRERQFEQIVLGGNGVGEAQQRAFKLAAALSA